MDTLDRLTELAGLKEEDNQWVASTKKLEQAFDLLRSLPLGEWVTTSELHKRMIARGHHLDLRTIQRAIHGYSQLFGIQKEMSKQGPRQFEWKRTAPFKID